MRTLRIKYAFLMLVTIMTMHIMYALISTHLMVANDRTTHDNVHKNIRGTSSEDWNGMDVWLPIRSYPANSGGLRRVCLPLPGSHM